jgi:hypothetical protein
MVSSVKSNRKLFSDHLPFILHGELVVLVHCVLFLLLCSIPYPAIILYATDLHLVAYQYVSLASTKLPCLECVTQHPSVRHPVETRYDSVVDG